MVKLSKLIAPKTLKFQDLPIGCPFAWTHEHIGGVISIMRQGIKISDNSWVPLDKLDNFKDKNDVVDVSPNQNQSHSYSVTPLKITEIKAEIAS